MSRLPTYIILASTSYFQGSRSTNHTEARWYGLAVHVLGHPSLFAFGRREFEVGSLTFFISSFLTSKQVLSDTFLAHSEHIGTLLQPTEAPD